MNGLSLRNRPSVLLAEQACEAIQGNLKVEASKVKTGNITK